MTKSNADRERGGASILCPEIFRGKPCGSRTFVTRTSRDDDGAVIRSRICDRGHVFTTKEIVE